MADEPGWLSLLWMLLGVTVYWAAIWYWLPALFKDREREPPHSRTNANDDARPSRPAPPR
jgi:hypothetical protein